MLSSPAKRRKTSAITSVRVDSNTNTTNNNDGDGDGDNTTKPTTPRRASFLSPTKASLARSHPHLARSSQSRDRRASRTETSRTEPRSRRLIDDLINAKSAAPIVPLTTDSSSRAPLQTRQPSAASSSTTTTTTTTTIATAAAARRDFVLPPVVPKLVSRFDGSTPSPARDRDPSPAESSEPTLPPTPVDLGWEDPPERPRGLSSSSPRRSRGSRRSNSASTSASGSGRHRQRLRNNHQVVTSSPLKPKDPSPRPVADGRQHERDREHDRESEIDMEEETVPLVGDAAAAAAAATDDEPAEIRQKREELRSLRQRLNALKQSSAKLEQALNAPDALDNLLDGDGDNVSLAAGLMTRIRTISARNTNFEQLIASNSEADKYLGLFAPGGLELTVQSSTTKRQGRTSEDQPRVVYHLTVSAPPPWPRSVFTVSLDVVTNAETAGVEQVLLSQAGADTGAGGIPPELYTWINTLLSTSSTSSDLHKRNVGLLLWGIGQYFDKAVQRAKAFWHLTNKYQQQQQASLRQQQQQQQQREDSPGPSPQVYELARYLGKTQVVIDLPPHGQGFTQGFGQGKLMLVWNIHLSWTGVAKSHCEIVPSVAGAGSGASIPDRAVPAVRELFARLVPVQGFKRAFDTVYEFLSGGGNGSGSGRTNKQSPSQKHGRGGDGTEVVVHVQARPRKRKKRIT